MLTHRFSIYTFELAAISGLYWRIKAILLVGAA